MMGRVVASPRPPEASGQASPTEREMLRVDLSGLVPGVYFVKVIDGEGMAVVRKIIKE